MKKHTTPLEVYDFDDTTCDFKVAMPQAQGKTERITARRCVDPASGRVATLAELLKKAGVKGKQRFVLERGTATLRIG